MTRLGYAVFGSIFALIGWGFLVVWDASHQAQYSFRRPVEWRGVASFPGSPQPVSSVAMPAMSSAPASPPAGAPCRITVYDRKYDGRRTASGERFEWAGKRITVAVPPRLYKQLVGRWVTITWPGNRYYPGVREVTAWVNDKCPAGSFDLNATGMRALLDGRVEDTVLRGGSWRLEK